MRLARDLRRQLALAGLLALAFWSVLGVAHAHGPCAGTGEPALQEPAAADAAGYSVCAVCLAAHAPLSLSNAGGSNPAAQAEAQAPGDPGDRLPSTDRPRSDAPPRAPPLS